MTTRLTLDTLISPCECSPWLSLDPTFSGSSCSSSSSNSRPTTASRHACPAFISAPVPSCSSSSSSQRCRHSWWRSVITAARELWWPWVLRQHASKEAIAASESAVRRRQIPGLMAARYLLLSLLASLLFPMPARLTPAPPGDSEYWKDLKSIKVVGGLLQPEWSPAIYDYTVFVADPDKKGVLVRAVVDAEKYDIHHLPAISLDGDALEYNDGTTFVDFDVHLNSTEGPYNRLYSLYVADPAPKPGWMFWVDRGHEYRIRVLQPPNFQLVTRLYKLHVEDEWGAALPMIPDRPDLSVDRYTFYVAGNATRVKVDIRCSKYATALQYQHDPIVTASESEFWTELDPQETHVQFQCQFSDPLFTNSTEERAYTLKFLRRGEDLWSVPVALMMSEDDGYCSSYKHSGKSAPGESPYMFVCRTDVAAPKMLGLFNQVWISLSLESVNHNIKYRLNNGVEVIVPMSEPHRKFRMKVDGGAHEIYYDVVLRRVANCSSMVCPAGLPHADFSHTVAARQRLCQTASCSEVDQDLCCEALSEANRGSGNSTGGEGGRGGGPGGGGQGGSGGGSDRENREGGGSQGVSVGTDGGGPGRHGGCAEGGSVVPWIEPGEDAGLTGCTIPGVPGGFDSGPTVSRSPATTAPPISQCGSNTYSSEDVKDRLSHYLDKYHCSPVPSRSCGPQCFLDRTCSENPPRLGGLGCYAAGVHAECRFCGFGSYPACPESHKCLGACNSWSKAERAWCKENLEFECLACDEVDTTPGPQGGAGQGGEGAGDDQHHESKEHAADNGAGGEATCSSYSGSCPVGFPRRPVETRCGSSTCSDFDCCGLDGEGHGGGEQGPSHSGDEGGASGGSNRHSNAGHQTCAKAPLTCPEGQALRADAHRAYCKAATCTDEDVDHCCVVAGCDEHAMQALKERKGQFFDKIGCSPHPDRSCYGQLCFFDETCADSPPALGGLGCWAGGINVQCRFCGFGLFPDCPAAHECSGQCSDWGEDERRYCNYHFGLKCPDDEKECPQFDVVDRYGYTSGQIAGLDGSVAWLVKVLVVFGFVSLIATRFGPGLRNWAAGQFGQPGRPGVGAYRLLAVPNERVASRHRELMLLLDEEHGGEAGDDSDVSYSSDA